MPLRLYNQEKITTKRLLDSEVDLLARLTVGLDPIEGELENDFKDRKRVWARCLVNFLKLVRYAIDKKTFEPEVRQ